MPDSVEVGIRANRKPLIRKHLKVAQINIAACIEIAPTLGVYPVDESRYFGAWSIDWS